MKNWISYTLKNDGYAIKKTAEHETELPRKDAELEMMFYKNNKDYEEHFLLKPFNALQYTFTK